MYSVVQAHTSLKVLSQALSSVATENASENKLKQIKTLEAKLGAPSV